MRRTARWMVVCFLGACGAGRARPASREAVSATGSEVLIVPVVIAPVEAAPLANAPTTDAVAARLRSLPAPPVSWTTSLSAISADELASMHAYESDAASVEPVEMTCANGSTVRIGGADDADEALADAHEVGRLCPVTIGDAVACRLAVREHPCHLLGATLPECSAIDACVGAEIAEREQWIGAFLRIRGLDR